MKPVRIVTTLLLILASVSAVFAQPPFEVPLVITDGVVTDTLYFGILPVADFCIVESDSFKGHIEFTLPPSPPCQCFDARFVWPRSSGGYNTCFDLGSFVDFRPFRGSAQKDTFRVRSQMGQGTIMVYSWPSGLSAYFSRLTLRYFDTTSNGYKYVDMLTNTSVDLTNAWFPITASIFADGVVVTEAGRNNRGSVPENLVLYQNYPNPFNPSTTIKFALPKAGHVTLKVYDLLGKEVATLVNEPLSPGTYERIFQVQGFPSGVFFCRLSAGGFVQTKKLLLLR